MPKRLKSAQKTAIQGKPIKSRLTIPRFKSKRPASFARERVSRALHRRVRPPERSLTSFILLYVLVDYCELCYQPLRLLYTKIQRDFGVHVDISTHRRGLKCCFSTTNSVTAFFWMWTFAVKVRQARVAAAIRSQHQLAARGPSSVHLPTSHVYRRSGYLSPGCVDRAFLKMDILACAAFAESVAAWLP